MTEKIELGKIFCGEYSEDCQVDRLQCPFSDCMAEVWAEKILSLGYHKTVWHKVADGDLPKETSLCLCKMKHKDLYGYEYNVLLFDNMYGFYNITNDAILAWTELPEYKE